MVENEEKIHFDEPSAEMCRSGRLGNAFIIPPIEEVLGELSSRGSFTVGKLSIACDDGMYTGHESDLYSTRDPETGRSTLRGNPSKVKGFWLNVRPDDEYGDEFSIESIKKDINRHLSGRVYRDYFQDGPFKILEKTDSFAGRNDEGAEIATVPNLAGLYDWLQQYLETNMEQFQAAIPKPKKKRKSRRKSVAYYSNEGDNYEYEQGDSPQAYLGELGDKDGDEVSEITVEDPITPEKIKAAIKRALTDVNSTGRKIVDLATGKQIPDLVQHLMPR